MWCAIFNIWADEPVFHELRQPYFPHETVCGRKIGTGKPLLPKKHARKFARPCKSCAQEAT